MATDGGYPKTTARTTWRETSVMPGTTPGRERGPGQAFASPQPQRAAVRESPMLALDAAVIQTSPMCAAARRDPVVARCRDRKGQRWNAPRGRDVREPYEGAQRRDELEVLRPRHEK